MAKDKDLVITYVFTITKMSKDERSCYHLCIQYLKNTFPLNNNSGYLHSAYLNDKGEHTALYKINNNVYIKTSKIINYSLVFKYCII